MSIEQLNDPSKIGERSSEPVDLVHDDDIDQTLANIREQFL
jgi:hypothetical protein